MEPQLPKRYVMKALKEGLAVESLFHKHDVTGPSILYKLIRNYLVLNDFQYVSYQNTNKMSHVLAKCLFDNTQDKKISINALQETSKSDPSSMNINNQNYNIYNIYIIKLFIIIQMRLKSA